MKERIRGCSQDITNKTVDCRKEKRKSFKLNKAQGRKAFFVNVDGCLFKNEQKKCDFLYELFNNDGLELEKVFFVELKGTDFYHGIEQLKATIENLKSYYATVCDKRAYLVGRAIPSVTTSIQRIKAEFKRKYNIHFTAKTNELSISE